VTAPTTLRWLVHGRVQGVGFRWFVLRRAEALGLAGWVRNLDSGAVEIVAMGREASLDDLEAAIRKGPPGAHVTDVTRSDVQHEVVEGNSFLVKG